MNCSLPDFSVHGIFQAGILEWVGHSFSRRSCWPRDQTQVSCIAGRLFTVWATREILYHHNALHKISDPLCLIASLSFPEVSDFSVKEKSELFEKEAEKPGAEERTQTFWWLPSEGCHSRQGTKREDVAGDIICGSRVPHLTFPLCDQAEARSVLYWRADVGKQASVALLCGCQGETSWRLQVHSGKCDRNTDRKSPPVSIPRGMDLPFNRRTALWQDTAASHHSTKGLHFQSTVWPNHPNQSESQCPPPSQTGGDTIIWECQP